MNALFPAMLAGIAGMAVPLALHLIARHRFPVARIPSVRFLQAERRSNVFAWKLVDLPQLLLRLLVLLLLVLAMARLFAPWLGTRKAPRNLMVVIDASASMRTEVRTSNGTETVLDRAKAEAVRLLEETSAPSRSGVLVAGARLEQLQELRLATSHALDRIREIQACDGAGPGLVRAVATACELLRGRREFRSQVVVLTDLRAGAFAAAHQEDLATIRAARKAMGRRLEILLVDVGDSGSENLAILDARVRKGAVRMGDDAHVIARIVNYGEAEVAVAPRLEIDGRKEPATVRRTIPPGGEIVVDIATRTTRAQRTFARALLQEPDALPHDNAFDLPLEVADVRRVLIVNGASAEARATPANTLSDLGGESPEEEDSLVDGATILRFALNPGRELGRPGGTGITPTVVTPDALAGQALSRFDMVILYDVSSLPDKALEDLDTYVRLGRAVVLFAGPHLNPMHFNRSLAAGGKDRPALSPAQLGNDLELAAPAALADNAVSHPLLSPFAEQRQGDLGVIRFVRLRELRTREASAEVLFADDAGRPLAVENRIEQGRVLLFTFGLELERGNLARARVFPPMMWRLTDYATGQSERTPDVPLTALRSSVMDVSEAQFAFVDTLRLSPLAGQADDLPTRDLPKSAQQTVLLGGLPAGRYRVHKPPVGDEAGTVADFVGYSRQVAVNPDPAESDTARADETLLQDRFGVGVRVLPAADAVSLAPTGAELARWLVILLTAAYAAEAGIGWWQSALRERERTAGDAA